MKKINISHLFIFVTKNDAMDYGSKMMMSQIKHPLGR